MSEERTTKLELTSEIIDATRQGSDDIERCNFGSIVYHVQKGKLIRVEVVLSMMYKGKEKSGARKDSDKMLITK